MEAQSLKSLIEIVERAENVTVRIRALNVADPDVHIPAVPLPLSLEATEAWLEAAAECCRKPLLARSKRLLEARGIGAATIPAAVLDRSDAIAGLLQRVDRLHEGLHGAAFESVGRALTKSIEDAAGVVTVFTAASRELRVLANSQEWVVALAAARMAETPGDAKAVSEVARRVIGHCNAVARTGIEVTPFLSLEDALAALTHVNTLIREHHGLLDSEGLSSERVAVAGLSVDQAVDQLQQATASLRSEKLRLVEEAQPIASQLEWMGCENRDTASTVAELRRLVPRMRDLLEERRRAFRASLGSTAFQVVESLAEGKLPAAENVTDDELGNAIRKAIACGYRFKLEAPRENR
jgi:hypothetical protein